MKKYELQYKMKKANLPKDFNEFSKAKILKRVLNANNDEFLESAEEFYKKTSFKRETPVPRHHNIQIDMKAVNKDVNAHQSIHTSRNSRITPENLKRSLEHDFNNNLEHWRKETFKYQQMVFTLQRKNSELIIENSNLKSELGAKDLKSDTQIINPEKDCLLEKQYYEIRVRELEKDLLSKTQQVQELEIVIKILSQKMKEEDHVNTYKPEVKEQKSNSPALNSMSAQIDQQLLKQQFHKEKIIPLVFQSLYLSSANINSPKSQKKFKAT